MNRNLIIALAVLIGSMLACAVPPGMTPTPVIVTRIVTVPEQQPQPSPTLPLSTAPPPTNTLLPTDTPVSTETLTATATLSGPAVTLIKNANCRNGAGTNFEVVTSYLEGQTLQIVGRNPDLNNTWWYVAMPTGGKCWISFATGKAYGPFDDIPIIP